MIDTDLKLSDFSETFSKEIFPLYKRHEETFDEHKMHGILHIGRSLVAAFVLHSELEKNRLIENPSIEDILFAVSYHDSGRKGNGPDVWEWFSSENCKNAGHNYASSMIVKNRKTNDYNSMCVYDADVLEVMRPCCGHGGIYGFEKKYLLLGEVLAPLYDKLINEWWEFIIFTESMKADLSIPDVIDKLLEIIKNNQAKFPLIHERVFTNGQA